MRLSKDPVNTVYKISQLIRTLTESDFEYLNSIAKQQEEFCSPLKPVLDQEQHKLAEHNKKMIFHLKELKELLNEK